MATGTTVDFIFKALIEAWIKKDASCKTKHAVSTDTRNNFMATFSLG